MGVKRNKLPFMSSKRTPWSYRKIAPFVFPCQLINWHLLMCNHIEQFGDNRMSFSDFIVALSRAEIEYEHLKVAQLAQAIWESGRGQSKLFKLFKNPFGMKYRPELASIATSISYTDSVGETDYYCKFESYDKAVEGYWRFIERAPYEGWRNATQDAEQYLRYIVFAGYLGGPHASVPADQRARDRKVKDEYVASLKKLFPEARRGLAEAAKTLSRLNNSALVRGKGVYIDVGHGQKPQGYDPGAVHPAKPTTEHALNVIAANACAKALQQLNIPVRVDDSNVGNLDAGRAAIGYDVFVSIHHNSPAETNPPTSAQGSEAFTHVSKGTAKDIALATTAATAMAKELQIRDRGPKVGSLSVLEGAKLAKVRAAILAELYFMHAQTPPNPSPSEFSEWSERGGKALGEAIAAWLADNP
jgi:N-acetylmuramoyl-L-alanine amidase